MKTTLRLAVFAATFLFSLHGSGQIYWALGFEFDYPTPSMSDGKVIPHLYGNYPGPVEYHVHLTVDGSDFVFTDTLFNLDEYQFSEALQVCAVDPLTGDTITGGYGDYITEDTELSWNSLIPPTDGFSCDGSFDGDVNVTYFSQIVTWYGPGLNLPSIDYLDLNNACAGYYYIWVPTNTGMLSTVIYFEPLTSTTGAFDVEVFTTPSSDGSCTATAAATVIGGQPPFQYIWDGVAGIADESALCPGMHSLTVVDANADSTAVLYGIADSSYFYEDTLFTGVADDTIYFMTEDCGIDYGLPIDSVAITFVDFFNDSTVAMGFTIWQGVDTYYVQDTTSYGPPSYGWYLVDLTQFCLNKDLSADVIKFRGAYERVFGAGTTEQNPATFLVYPNPVDQVLHVPQNGYHSIRIYNLLGEPVLQASDIVGSIGTGDLPNGIYQVIFLDENGNQAGNARIVVTH